MQDLIKVEDLLVKDFDSKVNLAQVDKGSAYVNRPYVMPSVAD